MQDLAGWLLLFSSFIVVMSFREVRKDRSVAITILFIVALHHLVAVTNAYIVSLHGIGDTYGFILKASTSADLGEMAGEIYGNNSFDYIRILSIIYMILGTSHFLGEELSVLAFTFSCIVFIKMVNIINVRRHRVGLLMLYGLLPAVMLYTSVALREAFQLLFLMLSVYFGLRIHIKPMKGAILFMVISILLVGVFHLGLGMSAVVIVPMFLLWKPWGSSINKRYNILRKRFVHVMLLIIFMSGGFYCYTTEYSTTSTILAGFGVLKRENPIESVKERVKNRSNTLKNVLGRTNYDNQVDFSSVGSIAKTIMLILTNYLFSPYPWQIRSFVDIIPGFEVLIRFFLIVFSIKALYKSQDPQRRLYGLLLLVYFIITIIFAAGTANYGTAMRHNIISYWLIVLVGGSGLIKSVTKFILPISKSEVYNSSCEIKGY